MIEADYEKHTEDQREEDMCLSAMEKTILRLARLAEADESKASLEKLMAQLVVVKGKEWRRENEIRRRGSAWS